MADRWGWDFDDEEPSSGLERWLAVKALGLLLLLVAAAAVLFGFWMLVKTLVQPEPYTDPETLAAELVAA